MGAKNKIDACPACGQELFYWMAGKNPLLYYPGQFELNSMYCDKCEMDVIPIEFQDKKSYAEFLESLKKLKQSEKTE